MSSPSHRSAFTLLEMLVATAVFAMLMMILLQMTSGLMSGATRMDENLKMEQDVRLFFDILRRDLAQARIGTNQNQFYGTETNLMFVSSTQRLKTNYVSDQRLVSYFLANATNLANGTSVYNVLRAVVEPTIGNTNIWNPMKPAWWVDGNFASHIAASNEVVLSGIVMPAAEIFGYYPPGSATAIPKATNPLSPPRGLKVRFNLLGQRALKSGVTNANSVKEIEYDVDLNLPPVFNP